MQTSPAPHTGAMGSDPLSPSLPSPTLTNPDMILPYTDNQRGSYSHSPPYEPRRLPSPPRMNPLLAHPTDRTSITIPFRGGKSGPPSNPLPYEGYEHGAPLSDIGEEAETTPRSRRTDRSQSPVVSPTLSTRFAAAQKLFKEARQIVDVEPEARHWERFDSISIADSGLQGDNEDDEDDEESLSGTEKGEGDDNLRDSLASLEDNDMSSNALSKRAERILANAKKRLTNMEGNLSRARTSLLISPNNKTAFSMGETQLPAGDLYRSISQNGDRRLSLITKNRQSQKFSGSSPVSSHTRVFSETSVPSPLLTSPQEARYGEIRSASAMEGGGGGIFESSIRDSSPTTSRVIRRISSSVTRSPFQTPLRPLREDEDAPTMQSVPPENSKQGLGISHSSSYENFQARHPPTNLARPASQNQVRDLQHQMNDLRSKISTLKTRAQEDNMRRRSLNSVRTPSPFTAAEQWYTSAAEYKEGLGGLSTNAGYGWSPKHEQNEHFEQPPEEEVMPAKLEEAAEEHEPAPKIQPEPEEANVAPEPKPKDQASVAVETNYQDTFEELSDESENSVAASEEEQIYLNEVLEESLHDQDQDVPDIPDIVSPEPERHEDRADAFDYEHFILHSALGSYSRTGFHPRGESRGSTESAETTRAVTPPPTAAGNVHQDPSKLAVFEAPRRRPHNRNNSEDSVSTMATFATATEGRGSDGEGEESDTIPEEVLNWGGHPPMPGAMNGWSNAQASDDNASHSSASTVHVNGYPTPVDDHSQYRPNTADSGKSTSTTREFPLVPNKGKLPTPPMNSPKQNRASFQLLQANETFFNSLGLPPRSPSLRNPSPVLGSDGDVGLILTEDDRDLLEGLFASLGNVCVHLSSDSDDSNYERKVWRRRLDTARRILDGELEIE